MAQSASYDDDGEIIEPGRRRSIENPFGPAAAVTVGGAANGALVAVEQQRAIAEVQAHMVVARSFPRDPRRAVDAILRDCMRPSLAQGATYAYARGGTDISGPTIKLLQAIAQRWGNIRSGIEILSRRDDISDCKAYAWDLESGYYDERKFQVRHWRDTKGGGYKITDERDIYELIANMGQRRKRAALETVIPGEVVEAALQQCDETLHSHADTSPEGIKKMLESLQSVGVNKEQIEARIQRRVESIRPAQVVSLRKIFVSLRDGMSEIADWFEVAAAGDASAGADEASGGTAQAGAGGARRGRPPSAARQRAGTADQGQGAPTDQQRQDTAGAAPQNTGQGQITPTDQQTQERKESRNSEPPGSARDDPAAGGTAAGPTRPRRRGGSLFQEQ